MALYAPTTQNALQKTLDAQLLTGATTITLNNTTGIPNLPGTGWVDRVNTSGVATPVQREYFSYTGTSGANLTGVTRGTGGSTDQDHAVGAIVEFGPEVVWAQAIYDALANLVNTTTLAIDTTKVVTPTGTQTLTNKTITAPSIGGTVSGSGTYTTPTLTTPVIQTRWVAKGAQVIGAAGATETVNWANGDRQFLTLDENITITFSNPAEGQTLTLFMLQDGSGTNTITFADSITWQDNTTPTWTTTANKMNIAVISYINGAYFGNGGKWA